MAGSTRSKRPPEARASPSPPRASTTPRPRTITQDPQPRASRPIGGGFPLATRTRCCWHARRTEGDGHPENWEGGSMRRLFWGEWTGRGSERVRRAKRGAAARRDHRPVVEGLEVRIAPAIDTWTGAVSASWTDGNNWAGGVAPKAGDDLVFPATAANLTNNNDFAGGTTFSSITIQGPGYNLTGNALNLTNGITASYATGASTDAINTAFLAVVAPITVSLGGTLNIPGVLSGAAGVNV